MAAIRYLFVILLLLVQAHSASSESITYDVHGRVSTVIYDNGTSISYEYDSAGSVVGVSTTGAPDLSGNWNGLTQKCSSSRKGGFKCTVTGSIVVVNAGSNGAEKFTVSFFYSDNSVLDVGDALLGASSTSRLAPGSTKSFKFRGSFVVASAPLTGFAIAQIDSNELISELDESNNVLTRAF